MEQSRGCPPFPSGPDDCPVSSAACLFRVNALSLVYLLFLLLLPWFPGPSRHSIRGKGGWGSVRVGVWIQGSQSSFSRCPGQGRVEAVAEPGRALLWLKSYW